MTNETNDVAKNAEFAFLVVKGKDGRYAIANVNNEDTARQPGLEDVYVSLVTLQKDIERQNLAIAVVQALQQVQQAQSPSGLVVPEKKFVKRS